MKNLILTLPFALLAAAVVRAGTVSVTDFPAELSDSARIAAAVKAGAGGIVVLPKRVATVEPARDWWLIDEAIRLPADTTLIIRDCKVKLSDRARDNFIRSANCGLGIEDVKPLANIRIVGEGNAVLEGAARPRATGDGSKLLRRVAPHRTEDYKRLAYWVPEEKRVNPLVWSDAGIHANTYGTDWDKPDESPMGDWRNIGILLANVERFAIENLTIRDSHAWAISLEACAQGRVRDIHFEMAMERFIDGEWQNIENQDGVNLRNGCHHITVENITGRTGDDVVALTAIAKPNTPLRKSGSLRTTHVMHNDWSKRETGIHHVIIRNIRAHSRACCVVRLLPAETVISNVLIDGVVDTLPADDDHRHFGSTILLGETDSSYGRNLPDSIRRLVVSGVVSSPRSNGAIRVPGFVTDAVFTGVVSGKPDRAAVSVVRPNGLRNVIQTGLLP